MFFVAFAFSWAMNCARAEPSPSRLQPVGDRGRWSRGARGKYSVGSGDRGYRGPVLTSADRKAVTWTTVELFEENVARFKTH